MKKLLLIALAGGTAMAIATPASAQNVTGTVDITGTVAPKCLVVPGAGNTFGTTVALGELAATDGTLATDLATRFSSVGGAGLSARVVCTTGAPTIAVDADPIASTTTADIGYSNTIDFTANVAVTTTTGAPTFTNASSGAASAATPIGGRLANNGSDNITITASAFTAGASNPLLVAGSYAGKITVVIAPSI